MIRLTMLIDAYMVRPHIIKYGI